MPSTPTPTPTPRVGDRFRDAHHARVGCVLQVHRRARRATVVWERPGGEDPLDVLSFARIAAGRRLPPASDDARRLPCLCCGTPRRLRLVAAAKLARKLVSAP